jgi:hypothetical protein
MEEMLKKNTDVHSGNASLMRLQAIDNYGSQRKKKQTTPRKML